MVKLMIDWSVMGKMIEEIDMDSWLAGGFNGGGRS
jgi:hypothetical protein